VCGGKVLGQGLYWNGAQTLALCGPDLQLSPLLAIKTCPQFLFLFFLWYLPGVMEKKERKKERKK
jgi:hypothetical protein